jgi:hypothetical protein
MVPFIGSIHKILIITKRQTESQHLIALIVNPMVIPRVDLRCKPWMSVDLVMSDI